MLFVVAVVLAVAPTAGFAQSPEVETQAESEVKAEVKLSPLATTGPIPEAITPPEQSTIREAIARGVQFLLDDQRPEGAWGSAEQTKRLNIYAPVPGAHHAFKTATTGLAIMALVEARRSLDQELQVKVDKALDRAQEWMLENAKNVRRAEIDAIYNTWGHSYGLQGLVRLYERTSPEKTETRARLFEAMQIQVEKLERYAFLNGGWGYYDFDAHTQIPASSPNSFTTATGLVALKEAQRVGIEVSQKLVDKAIVSIERQRNPDFTYAYGEYLMMQPVRPINRAAGSLGRSQACNYALAVWDQPQVTDEVIKTWLNRLYARNGWLSIGRKRPVPHESYFQVAGYFYYYGHFYAALSFELLPDDERPYFQDHMAHILLPLQEKDGSWWDYPFYNYHQQYGTAMAVVSLARSLHDSPARGD
jgi:hypothetical protein